MEYFKRSDSLGGGLVQSAGLGGAAPLSGAPGIIGSDGNELVVQTTLC
jgi:hypothetical protein